MKRLFTSFMFAVAAFAAAAQNVQDAATQAAMAMAEADKVNQRVEKVTNWSTDLKTQINVGQTSLTNWAAGGDNTISLQGFVDGNANWKKNSMFWNNRLQLDYGFLYASSKPILQKSSDRIYLESKWGYKTAKMNNLYFSANYDFKSQFTTGYDYNTPAVPEGYESLEGIDDKGFLRDLWRDARVVKSGFFAPAYTNLALGIDYKPFNWISVNFAPLTGGFVIVRDEALRGSYSMPLKKEYEGVTEGVPADGSQLSGSRFEFGAQLKIDGGFNINDNFKYSTQVVLFTNYLDINRCPRINWDNRIDWKLAKYFSFTITTNLIYDDTIIIVNPKDATEFPEGKARVQFKESLAFGFTWTIANKK